jgi:glycosyltransferase involved in cell wall biosynthesis
LEVFNKYFNNFKENLLDIPLHSVIKDTIFQFEYLFLNRYPKLCQIASCWHKIFEENLPKVVIGSRLPDSENQLPLTVASELNVVAISVPHSVNLNIPCNLYIKNTHILSSHTEEVNQYINSGWKVENIHFVSGLELYNEYLPLQTAQPLKFNKFKILVLVNPCGLDNIVYRTISIPNQLKAIAKLSKFVDNSENYHLQFKTHPGFPNKEIFEICGENILSKLLPIDSSLQEVLQNIDLVIGLNYSEAAVIHSVNSRKPVILCWDDAYFLETKSNVNSSFKNSCEICYSVDNLIVLIEQFFNNSNYNKILNDKVNNYVNSKTDKCMQNDYISKIRTLSNLQKDKTKFGKSTKLIPKIEVKTTKIVSIIIPTYNRVSSLVKAIKSIYTFNAAIKDKFEVIVVDNGSTDQTAIICAEIKKKVNNFVYIYEPVPGLLSGRHAGANVAKGEILTFVDDDIEITDKWLQSIIEVFENQNIHLAGGPTLPIFESEYPDWILYYFEKYDVKIGTGYLSLKNREEVDEYVVPLEIWGLNFSIRKQTFLKCGGFHPDNIKKELQYFQGDGETGLTIKLRDLNYLAFYSSNIKVFHNVYNNRMTPEYFQERAFYQGVCDSFTQLKNKKVLDKIVFPVGFNRTIPSKFTQYTNLYTKVHQYYVYGFYYHQYACVKSDIVYNWVMKEDYFDYQLPLVPLEFHNEMVHLRNNLHLLDKIINF